MNERAFREAMGRFATGVTIVTTTDTAGAPAGLTVNSFNSVSLDPPLVLFSLDRGGQLFDTFAKAEVFAVNVLGEDQIDLSNKFAGPPAERWKDVAFHLSANGCPALDGVLVLLECDVEARLEGGDHVIYIGRVRNVETRGDGRPLLYYRGGYRKLAASQAERRTPPPGA